MSAKLRVHELAKELGLDKAKDLIDRIQEWGLDVKPSAVAGVDEETAAEIRRRMHADSAGPAVAAPAPTPPPATAPESAPKTPTAEAPAISPTAASPRTSEGAAPASAPPPVKPPQPSTPTLRAPVAPAAEGPAPTPAPTPATPAAHPGPTMAQPPVSPSSGPAPAPARPSAPMSQNAPASAPRPTMQQTPASGPSHRPAPPQGPSGGPPRQAGPLAGHTRSGTGPRPGGPSPQGEARPRPGGAPHGQPGRPLERGDYIGPAGTRPASGRPATIPPPRRPGEGGDVRRDGPRPGGGRPLPPVASGGGGRPLPPVAPPGGPPKRPEGPRPGGPAAGGNVQPQRRFTREEMLEMMRRGQLPTAPPPPGREGSRGPRPEGGLASPPPGLPAGPGGRGPVPGAPARAKSPADFEDDDRKGKGGGPGGAGGRFGSGGGGATDRAGRRKARQERAKDRGASPLPAAALLDSDDDGGRRRGPKRHKARGPQIAPKKSAAVVEPPITLRSLSEAIGIKANQLMRRMMDLSGQLVTINTTLDEDAAIELALEFGVELSIAHEETAEDQFEQLLENARAAETAPEHLQLRPPIVTILGHVDHGKTSLLDYVRKANVVATETGGITQHIGAYQVEQDGRPVTFVDTPGHEAFTAMRARGANVTDIAVVVVAADDGVMPQTKEAIAHAKAAGVQIVVALNKIDLPGAEGNVNRILGELSTEGLIPEEYGGDVPVVRTSATTGRGIDDLLATLATIAEVYEYKANPDRPATGTCLEAEISEGRGVIATVLVQDGTLRVGDAIACGEGFGRVRALFDDKGRPIQEAGPSTPVEISGLDAVPTAGEKFAVLEGIGDAREFAEIRRSRSRGASLFEPKAVTLENLYSKMAEQKVKSLNIILKADVQGSLEALVKEIDKLENDEVPVRILHRGVGGITESDVMLADASEAIVIGFRVAPEDRAVSLAEENGIDVRRYDIIYQVSDEIKQAIEGRLEPEIKEVHLGRAVVRQVFKISRGGAGTVAGCFVTQGIIERNAQARIIREGREIYKGAIEALRRFKDDVREVRENFECGIKIAKFDDIKVDDVIEAYRVEVIRRTL